jgi:hypothetical protein
MANTHSESVFATLSSIDVRNKIERKGNLDYLSWANAWAMLKLSYPEAQRKVYEHDHTGFNYFTDGKSAWVKVGIIVDGIEHIDYLPIMDFRNNAIPIEKLTAMDVNKAIQRSTAKAIAMHGLGLSLWTGEDVPNSVSPEVTETKSDLIELTMDSDNWKNVLKYVEANKTLGITKITNQLKRKYKITGQISTHIAKLLN